MTAVTAPTDAPSRPRAAAASTAPVVSDALTMAWRNLLNIRRNPQLLVFATIQPIIFVLMFRYVFGGAIDATAVGDVPYVDFLMPGIFVQTVVFGALTHRRRPRRGPAEGPHRPVPLAADGALGGAARPHARRPRPQRLRACS